MSEVPPLNEREEQAWRGLQFMQMRLTGRLARDVAATSELSYPDYVVLVALTDRPDGRMRLFELGAVLGWEKSRFAHHVGRMAERGLVTKERCGDDRRGAYVVVTKRGRQAIDAASVSLVLCHGFEAGQALNGPLDRLRRIPQHQCSPALTGDPSTSEQHSERLCVGMGDLVKVDDDLHIALVLDQIPEQVLYGGAAA